MLHFAQTKVGDFYHAIAIDENVVRVQVTVHDWERFGGVQVNHSLRDRHRPSRERERGVRRSRSMEKLVKRSLIHVLENDGQIRRLRARAEPQDDGRVPQSRQYLHLATEIAQPFTHHILIE